MLPAVKAAHTGMAAPAPAGASDLTGIEKMERPELEAALTARGISFKPKRWLKTLRKMLAEAQGGAAAAAARPAGASAPSSAADAFKQAFLQAGRTALRPEDITANVRSILNGGAHALPQTKASLDKVAKSLREVRAARESGDPLPGKRHRCVEECLKSDDPVMVGLMLLALQVDLDTRLQRLATLHEKAKNGATGAAAGGPDPVLSALGEDGLNRLMWEYYKAYVHKRPKYGKPVAMAYKPGSYLQQLHAILVNHFAKSGSSPENASPLPHMKNPKALRDALCRWCVFWTQTCPPFFRDGPRADWKAEQWEALPMHSLPGEDIQRHPVYENDACRAEEAEEDDDAEDEQAADDDEGTVEDARPVSEVALHRLTHQRKSARHEVPELETVQESGDEEERA